MHAKLSERIAHRGASADAPENTLEAIELAIELGARCVELDAMISADGIAFLHHDDKLERCTNGRGYLCAHDAESLAKLNAGKRFADSAWADAALPPLADALELLSDAGAGLNLEIKPTAGLEHETARVVVQTLRESHRLPSPLVLSSFSERSLETVQQMQADSDTAWATALITVAVPDDVLERIERLGCSNLHCAAELLTAKQARKILDHDLGLYVYTVNDDALFQQVQRLGVHGVFSDQPHRLNAA